MRFFHSSILGFAICGVLALGCSSSSDSGPSGNGDTGTPPVDTGSGGTDTGTKTDTGTSGDTTTSDTPSEGGGKFTLKVENYLSWCNVSVNGGTASGDAVQTITVDPGTVVNLHSDPLSSTFV